MFRIVWLALALLVAWASIANASLEEFQVFGPTDFYEAAVDKLSKMRKEDPKIGIDKDSPFMIEARAEAVKRFRMRPPSEIKLQNVAAIGSGGEQDMLGDSETLLQLPAPSGVESLLSHAVAESQSKSYSLVAPAQAVAEAVEFNDEIGLGAISKAGALPMGDKGEWLKYAESKLQNDNELDYQNLLWEMGTSIIEKRALESGGVNVTKEEELLTNMKEWFEKGGGKLKYVEPAVTESGHFELRANEDIDSGESILSVPMKLIMCQQSARNILIHNKGRYLGEELSKTFERDEIWGLSIFLLHEYYKDKSGVGSKWGPFIRTLRMRSLTVEALKELQGTMAVELMNKWVKSVNDLMWFSSGADGPCSPSSGICKTKPREMIGDTRFNIHHLRWAYWVVKQNSVKVRHATTGYEFIGLIPYYNMINKKLDKGGGISFDFDGSINIRIGEGKEAGMAVGIHPGNFSDSEFFLRYMSVPETWNNNTMLKLSLPGTIPKGSKFHFCIKGTEEQMRSDECKGSYKSDAMFWKSKVLSEWRKEMNLPPRMQELRTWATKLHLYGGKDEMKLLSASNRKIAGLPIPEDQMPAEEQLMFLGAAKSTKEAALMVRGEKANAPPPQLYSAPDPEEDPEAKRNMENLALLAAQAQMAISSGNTMLNATRAVLNQTKNFFVHGVLPMAGLDELDNFLLKKIGLLSHCGFENDMKIVSYNITEQLMCAMRVHLMNESEVAVFCPQDSMVWEESCLNVEFMNYTAISFENEKAVVSTLKNSIYSLLSGYPTTIEEDKLILANSEDFGEIKKQSVRFRMREKELLLSALEFLHFHDSLVEAGNVTFQILQKRIEREKADIIEKEKQEYIENIRKKALERSVVATVEVNLGQNIPAANLTLYEGHDIKQTIVKFCQERKITDQKVVPILEKALKERVRHPQPLQLIMGFNDPDRGRRILGVQVNANVTEEIRIFCSKHKITDFECKKVETAAEKRLNPLFDRKILLVVPVDAPDTRKLKLVVYEGEQHNLLQLVNDFFAYYRLPEESAYGFAVEVDKRLAPPTVIIPINADNTKLIVRFAQNDNITNVVEGFVNNYESFESIKLKLIREARFRMAPGSYMVPDIASP